ncbi:hypothetical protein MHYP_G00135940 [Metynnis hypsauchen]
MLKNSFITPVSTKQQALNAKKTEHEREELNAKPLGPINVIDLLQLLRQVRGTLPCRAQGEEWAEPVEPGLPPATVPSEGQQYKIRLRSKPRTIPLTATQVRRTRSQISIVSQNNGPLPNSAPLHRLPATGTCAAEHM